VSSSREAKDTILLHGFLLDDVERLLTCLDAISYKAVFEPSRPNSGWVNETYTLGGLIAER